MMEVRVSGSTEILSIGRASKPLLRLVLNMLAAGLVFGGSTLKKYVEPVTSILRLGLHTLAGFAILAWFWPKILACAPFL